MGKDYLPDIAKSLEINQSACAWTVKALTAIKQRLGTNIKLHDPNGDIKEGQIFLFNHFARSETVITHYLVHRESGAYCRSVASSEFFVEDNKFSRYIRGLGAVPNNHPNLLPFLAGEILHGRKIVFFPEGGMVKDRLVVDRRGEFNVYSRVAKVRRKHHSGAAVLALTLDAFKTGILELYRLGEFGHIDRWARELELASSEDLIKAVSLPTKIIPSNITFFPIRVTPHLMHSAMHFFGGDVSSQVSEEMLIEGNILFKHTDMDICLGNPVYPVKSWNYLHRKALANFVREKQTLTEMFSRSSVRDAPLTWLAKGLVNRKMAARVGPLRDTYMREMYDYVMVNLSHLASYLIICLHETGTTSIKQSHFNEMLYRAIKEVQTLSSVNLHRGLHDPSVYRAILINENKELEEILQSAYLLGLIQRGDGIYTLMPTLAGKHDFDRIRVENPLAVAANEIRPLTKVTGTIDRIIDAGEGISDGDFARLLFDDMVKDHAWTRKKFSAEKYAEINNKEPATENAEPYLLIPENHNGLGIVLVHGFLASPAELRELGEKLYARGHPVIGVRLKGHGTSPCDLRNRTWQEWYGEVKEGYRIMAALAEKVCVVGFSTGGTLSLMLGAEKPDRLAAVVAAATALKFMNRNLVFIPLMHGANKITNWLPSYEGVMPYRENQSEHPTINYHNMPIRGLFELRRAVDELENKLKHIECPVALFQGTMDPVVDPKSADIIFSKLTTKQKWLYTIASKRHGIVTEDIDGTQEKIIKFLASLVQEKDAV
ncbi:MAG: alpha/beta fold hydrolase [Proteobacteria bacterium]|nr:alpha/beta fold hydrolase [Pseudomonadota bacterium]